ncbi:putative ubiquitin-protein ligase [Operophtera brumata]|uniref:HECT-type E3 ubiquitin transferase n=1 Tax=Operophtera brumata TaxID=104452 RepID=A0A0L7LKC1_OPEBR|nr:putative ubiquitin-protein ligase [Operophtera brumata]
MTLRVARDDLVASSLKATRHFSVADWCKNFDVTFQGEQGIVQRYPMPRATSLWPAGARTSTSPSKESKVSCNVIQCEGCVTRVRQDVARDDLVASSLKATRHFSVADWCKNFDVTFQGEQGVDWGGVRREWFSLLCAQLFDAKNGLFVSFNECAAGLVHPNPQAQRPPHLKLKHFELAGKLFGKCLYDSALGGSYRQLVRARLTRSFLAQIIGLRVHYKYFEQDDPELFLSKIKYVLETDLEEADCGMELNFSDDVYSNAGLLLRTHELLPAGASIRVNNKNKIEYLDALAQWRLATRCRLETEAFLRGLALLVPENLLAIFDENELERFQLLACGTGEVNVADWRAHARLIGAGRDWERLMSWLWAALDSFTNEERARLLQFTTGCSQLPPGGFQVCAAQLLHYTQRSAPGCCSSRQAARSCRPVASMSVQHSSYITLRGARQAAAVHDRLLQFTTGCCSSRQAARSCRPVASRSVQHSSYITLRGARQAAAVHDRLLAAAARWLPEERARLLQFTTGCSQRPPGGFQERARLLQFTTGCSQLPPGGFQTAAVHDGLLAAAARRLPGLCSTAPTLHSEERARLLQFTTGCSQLPPGGFQDLNPRFQITGAASFGALPTAHTCFNQLCLPDYDSYEQLVHAIQWAINEGGEGFGLI